MCEFAHLYACHEFFFNSYMASIDIPHAYYSIPIAVEHKKCLCFKWKGTFFQYTYRPNGISCAPRYFTKLLKPVYATLRQLGHINMGYIDDSLLVADEKDDCIRNVNDTKCLFEKVGFIIHDKKSIVVPIQKLKFLGFLSDSVKMVETLPVDKIDSIVQECKVLLKKQEATIREVAKVIGILVSVFQAVEYGPLHYRNLELQKIDQLKNCKGNYNSKMRIANSMKTDLRWWLENIQYQYRNIDHGTPEMVITTDAP